MKKKDFTEVKKRKNEEERTRPKMAAVITAAAVAITLMFSGLVFAFIMLGKGEDDEPDAPVFNFGDTVDVSDALYTYTQMEEDLNIFADRYGDIFKLGTAGKSVDGRQIYYVMLGDESADKTIMINAGIHGREYLTPLLVMKQLEFYTENFDIPAEDGKTVREIFAGFRFCVVPMINPDGIAISQFGLDGLRDEQVRETARKILGKGDPAEWKANAAGVDLNRNFKIAYWNAVNTGITVPSSQFYKGPSPESEPETKAMVTLTKSLKNLVLSISYHSQGEIVFWDCGQKDKLREDTLRLVDVVTDLTGYSRQNSYTSPDATYNDWCVLNLGIPSINIETGRLPGSRPLPISQFEKIWTQNKLLWIKIVQEFS